MKNLFKSLCVTALVCFVITASFAETTSSPPATTAQTTSWQSPDVSVISSTTLAMNADIGKPAAVLNVRTMMMNYQATPLPAPDISAVANLQNAVTNSNFNGTDSHAKLNEAGETNLKMQNTDQPRVVQKE